MTAYLVMILNCRFHPFFNENQEFIQTPTPPFFYLKKYLNEALTIQWFYWKISRIFETEIAVHDLKIFQVGNCKINPVTIRPLEPNCVLLNCTVCKHEGTINK